MIRVFESTSTDFDENNGECVLLPVRCEVTNNLNGDFYVEIETTRKYLDFLEGGKIIAINIAGDVEGFRVRTIDVDSEKVTVKAYHVSYDMEYFTVRDYRTVYGDGEIVLYGLFAASNPPTEISALTYATDVTDIHEYHFTYMSLAEAVQIVCEVWNANLVRHNWNIGVYKSISRETEYEFLYGKNLENVERLTNWDNVVTKILPIGKDGTLLSDLDYSRSSYIISDVQYPWMPFGTKIVNFTQDGIYEDDYKNSDGEVDEIAYKTALIEDLEEAATFYLNTHKVPLVSYNISTYAHADLKLGDKVTVKDEGLGVDIRTQVIGYKYDAVLKEFSEFTLGNFQPTLSDIGKLVAQNS